jgi:hypothetical protein
MILTDKEAAALIQEAAAGSLEYATFTKAEWRTFEFSASVAGGVCATSTTGSVEVEIDFTLPSHRAFYDGRKVARKVVRVLEIITPDALSDNQQDDLYGTLPDEAESGVLTITDENPTWAEFTGANEIVSFALRLDLGGGLDVGSSWSDARGPWTSWVITATVALGVRATTGD